MAKLASLWIGDRLGDIEIASCKSFLRHGNDLTLYTYGDVAGVPEGVTIGDARSIYPNDNFVRHHGTGSPALHANFFRYALITKTDKVWVDIDIIALKPFVFESEYVLGFETETRVANSIIGLPNTCETAKILAGLSPDTRGVPFHVTGFRRAKYQVRNWLTPGGLSIEKWPWGSMGPLMVTLVLNQTGEISKAQPIPVFNSVAQKDCAIFAEPGALSFDDFPPEAQSVHLWGKDLRRVLTKRFQGRAPEGSFIRTVLEA